MTTSSLVVSVTESASATLPEALRSALQAAGCAPLATVDCHMLVRRAAELAPQLIVLHLPVLAECAAVQEALRGWTGMPPCPLLLLSAPLGAALHAEFVTLGVQAWGRADSVDAIELQALFARAQSRWQRERELRDELERLRTQLDERKWVDRAKGLLMAARGIDEDDAFRMLRVAAMHANLRLGEVSRSVVEAAQWAEAVNRAGQLRMLSQRLARLAAQALAEVDVRGSRAQRADSLKRVQLNLEHLTTLGLQGTAAQAFERARSAWQALEATLKPRATPAALIAVDAQAETLLEAAESLTDELELSGARRALRIVNLCGRQRMRAQRVAKDALFAALLPEGPWRERLESTIAAFEATLLELERAPLSSPEIRDALAGARDEWLRLLRGVRAADRSDGRADLVRASEVLVDAFDALTASYEHSLQVVMS
jgi:AmiR/NasT family two-component response regulator